MRLVLRYWWVILVAVALWYVHSLQARVDRLTRDLSAQLAAVADSIGPGIVRVEPVIVPGPTLVERVLQRDPGADALVAELSAELRAALAAAGERPATVAVARSIIPGDTMTWRMGETWETPRLRLTIPEPETYRLTLRPISLRLAMIEARDGSWVAEVRDEAGGVPLSVASLDVRKRSQPVAWRWFRWGLQAGATVDDLGAVRPAIRGEGVLLRLRPPTGLAWDVGAATVGTDGAFVGVRVWTP